MLPLLVQRLPADRKRLGLSEGHMAWLLGLTRPQYRALEAGEMELTDFDLVERIWDVSGWPR